jgi:hypothetical protein
VIIDIDGVRQLIACSQLNQRVQVHHRPTVLPHKCVKEGVARGQVVGGSSS